MLLFVWLDFTWNFGHRGVWLLIPGLALTCLGCRELVLMMRSRGYDLPMWPTIVSSLMVAAAVWMPILYEWVAGEYPPNCPLGRLGWPWAAMGLAVVISFLGQMIHYKESQGVVIKVGLSIFTVAYVGLLMSFLFALRIYKDNHTGMLALVTCVAVAKFGDAGAYFAGRFLGRHKLAPRMSPGKTIEGAIGGIAASCAASAALFYWLTPLLLPDQSVSIVGSLIFGVIVGGAGMLGDLAESVMKRDFQAKDSGTMLPGLGGVLDILDSILFAAPAAFACWLLEIVP